MKPQQKKINHLVSTLLEWFAKNARDLPWRRTIDPYAVFVSEIMLQQTQVKTVIPYWERWMSAMSTIADLARADPQVIHKLWEGLGYYTRVRNMQSAAQKIMAQHGGKFPEKFEEILDLPGIGPYTAGAISSIAFNQPQPILDGNVIRVLTRVFAIAENPREKITNQKLWQLARELVVTAAQLKPAISNPDLRVCSHLNQALMELGALICTPKQPRCAECPIRTHCTAFRTNKVNCYPNLGPRAAVTHRHFVALVIQHRNRFLVRQRLAGQVNAHLWEFPNFEIQAEAIDVEKLARENLGLTISKPVQLQPIKHSVTRYRINLQAWRAKTDRVKKDSSQGHWLTLNEMSPLPFTSAQGKVLKQIVSNTNERPTKSET